MLDRGFPRTVTVYGTGLIGCSFALALKQTIPGVRLYGIDSVDILNRARAIGAIETPGTGPAEASDLVILSTPVGRNPAIDRRIAARPFHHSGRWKHQGRHLQNWPKTVDCLSSAAIP